MIKQKFPFSIIEDLLANLLARLGNKKVFTLIDLKDSFHLIKIHPDSTKYFSFATPLASTSIYGYLYIVNLRRISKESLSYTILIREDKVLVYIDDILIPSVEE